MFSNKTPNQIYSKLKHFFKTRKENKYRSFQDEDDSDFLQKTKEEIQQTESNKEKESTSQIDEQSIQNELEALDPEKLEGDIDDLAVSAKLKKLLKRMANVISKEKSKDKNEANFAENDLAPSRGNQVSSKTSMSKAEMKKKVNKHLSIRQSEKRQQAIKNADAARQNANKENADVDLNSDGKVDNQEKGTSNLNKQKENHLRIRADAINDTGEKERKSEWVAAVSDSGREGGRGR